MKKKSIMVRLGVVAMALTMITTSLSSGTLAKYTEQVSAETQIKIARWDAGAYVDTAGGNTYLGSESVDIGTLLKASKSKEYTGVANGRIAPGMQGTFNINVQGNKIGLTSDVDIEYKVYVDAEKYNMPTNLKFSSGSVGYDLSVDPSSLGSAPGYEAGLGYCIKTGTIEANNTKTDTVQVEWKWLYEQSGNVVGGDEDDLEAGSTDGKSDSDFQDNLIINVVMTQKKPVAGSKEQTT